MLEWALYYAQLGMPVFPCRGKVPAISKEDGGHGFYDATTDLQQVTTWWQQYPRANIGYRTSATAPVLDVDPQHQGDDTLFALEHTHGALPDTRRVITGGPSKSTHYYFTSPVAIPNKSFLGVGIDVQSEGSYVIAPPSLHPATGQPYRWDIGPDELAPQPLPPWLLQLLLAGDLTATSASQILDPAAPIPDGQRTITLARLAIRLRRVAGLSADEILAALMKRNDRCVPPKPQDYLSAWPRTWRGNINLIRSCTWAACRLWGVPAWPMVRAPRQGTSGGAQPFLPMWPTCWKRPIRSLSGSLRGLLRKDSASWQGRRRVAK